MFSLNDCLCIGDMSHSATEPVFGACHRENYCSVYKDYLIFLSEISINDLIVEIRMVGSSAQDDLYLFDGRF